MKKHITIILLAFMFVLLVNSSGLAFELDAESAILIEGHTGQVLYERDADKEMPPASITKIMTMLLTMEAVEAGEISLDDVVTISQEAANMGGSQIYLNAGNEVTIEDLLKAVVISSANDATYALSEEIGGSYPAFVQMMNDRAEELSMDNTNFMNSTGLPEENHYTTARDISKMSREVIKYPEIQEWGQIWVDYIELPDRDAMLANLNQLINIYDGLDGIKTGRTEEAGYSLAASAKRDDLRLISVVLRADNEEERQQLTTELLDYGFNNYSKSVLYEKDETIRNVTIPGSSAGEADVKVAEDLTIVLPRQNGDLVDTELLIPEEFTFPIAEGEQIGEIAVHLEGDEVNRVELLAAEDINRANIFTRIIRFIADFFTGLF